MSGASKKSHEESGHSSSKYGHEDVPSYPRLMSAVSNDYHPSHDLGQENRIAKLPRIESRDADRRSPMHSIYRMPSSSMDDSHSDHLAGSESRLESRELKDNRDPRVENRELKMDQRELYSSEAKRDIQSGKIDKDGKFETRVDESKKTKYDAESHTDLKGDFKAEKDGHSAGSGYLNWKDSKEYHRGKRYPDSSGVSIDSWHISRNSSQGPFETTKEDSTMEERGYGEAHEAIGENKVDLKAEDKLKDKDRKRKDLKHRDWGEKDKERSDRRSTLPVGISSSDGKEFARDDREVERWDKERKDLIKDKERLKEREKDHSKREMWTGPEKDVLHPEKESLDVPVKMTEQENPAAEPKKHKDSDGWKHADKEPKDKKKERDSNIEGEKIEKRGRGYDKESEDGYADGDGAEREREVFNYDGVQQRKRMLRPRGSPQTASRDSRFRSRMQDNEGSQVSGKAEVCSVVYKVGESMQELIKLWKEYELSPSDQNGESSRGGPTLEIRIPAEHVTATNRQVRGGQLWGTDIYTYDSDLVAVLMHTGFCRPTASPPPSAIQELRATIRVLPPLESYISTLRNNVRSRAWGAAIGCSYCVERCCIVKKGGGTIDLEPCITHTSTVEPTLAPVAVERTMTTRAAASNALRQQRFVREVTIQYNLCNEPWIKYSLSIVADKGLKKPLYTSARLKKGEVLYLETHSCRYELSFTGEKMVKATVQLQEADSEKSQNNHAYSMNGERNESDNMVIDVFRWSRCKKPLPQKVMRSIGIPLPLEYVEVLEENLDWEDVQWSQTGVWIAGKEYLLARVHFLSPN
ncbi:uncharacterized protein LOC116211729 isoform X1 [Punica granatum]|uniref:Uncharacterized protein LOC116211729 isoform X1 n=2 Tax=Punica granatum TaxID=22663 RepID=A0A6P8E9T4_PUNGR|nr:uncharacterized protein LOC116211729 isoform X1 [Punica granatum]XP_031402087.1 uncharacterized protein LOC116211729 isoform X1 [Punica granatum]